MFAMPNTPTHNRGSPWSRYITPDLTPSFPTSSSFIERTLSTQSLNHQPFSSPSPTSSHSLALASPVQTPFDPSSIQRQSTPVILEEGFHSNPMHAAYPNSPSPQPFGIIGGLLVSEPASMLQRPSSDCGTVLHSDIFLSQPVSKISRPALRSSLSHNAVLDTPSPSIWPRRSMTISALSTSTVPTPGSNQRMPADGAPSGSAIAEENNSEAMTVQHEANTPSLSLSATSTTSTSVTASQQAIPSSSSSSTHPYGYPQYAAPFNDASSSSEYPYNPSPYGTPAYASAPYPQPNWQMTSISHAIAHKQQQPQYHWADVHAATMPGKQDEPILATGELPAPRPPMSYAALIGEALLLASPPHQLYVSEISDSIKKRYPYYRQNPTKIYNGVRHQTSMCKAFVKLPRPFGDQTGGARKWGIRAGCEGWFAGGGYHPPSNAVITNKPNKNRKAKSTARSKLLAVGMSGGKKLAPGFPSPTSSDGPSSGPAYDGSSGSVAPYQQPYSAAAFSSPATNSHLPPGYHYIPVNSSQNCTQPQPIYVPVWGPYAAPNPPPQYQGHFDHGSQSPETWRKQVAGTQSSDGTSLGSSFDEVKVLPIMDSPTGSIHSFRESLHSSHGNSPETL
ncbi:hypothetical protein I311_02030 [Cryptococcus gattii NT-10]|nr:hypothetical protein I311_02030 [Cryptococcus gattii NT-10]